MAFLSYSVVFLAALVVLVGGLLRLIGRRNRRLDGIASATSAAAAMSVYPASLRGVAPMVPPAIYEDDVGGEPPTRHDRPDRDASSRLSWR